MKKIFTLILVSTSVFATCQQQTLIHYWHFNNLSTGLAAAVDPSTLKPISADYSLLPLSNPKIIFATLPGTSSSYKTYWDSLPLVADATQSLNARQIVGQPAICGDCLALRVRNPSDSMQLLFYISTVGYQNISIKFSQIASGSGVKSDTLSYSIDGGANWLSTGQTLTTNTISSTSWSSPVINDSITNLAANNNANLVFRIRSGAVSNTSNGNYRIDNVTVEGTPISLPLIIKAFAASLINSQPQLNWETSNETNFDYFGIEKSVDAKNFAAINEVASKKASNGSTYSYVDATKTLATQFYRLKLVDNDGTLKYSNVVAVNGKPSISLALYPNPVTNTIILSHPKAIAGAAIKITSIDGRTLSTITVQTGATQTSIDATTLVNGNYVVSFVNNGSATTTQLVKQ